MAHGCQARGAHPIFLTPVAAITCSGSTAVGNRGFLTETTTPPPPTAYRSSTCTR